ncbi:hypothetical protein WCP94_001208 [Bilophila wadsworthia]
MTYFRKKTEKSQKGWEEKGGTAGYFHFQIACSKGNLPQKES